MSSSPPILLSPRNTEGQGRCEINVLLSVGDSWESSAGLAVSPRGGTGIILSDDINYRREIVNQLPRYPQLSDCNEPLTDGLQGSN